MWPWPLAIVCHTRPARPRLVIREEHEPYWSTNRLETTKKTQLIAKTGDPSLTVVDARTAANKDTLARDTALRLLTASLENVKPVSTGAATGTFSILVSTKANETRRSIPRLAHYLIFAIAFSRFTRSW